VAAPEVQFEAGRPEVTQHPQAASLNRRSSWSHFEQGAIQIRALTASGLAKVWDGNGARHSFCGGPPQASLAQLHFFVYVSVTPVILLSGSVKPSDGSSDMRHMAAHSMDNSLIQTWSVESFFVFGAMLIFSVLWLYVKLLMMMYAWVTPMDHGIRGPTSFMDNIILFLLIVFFWASWTGDRGGGKLALV
ncbi:ytlA, partial [Symbiodinium pilosum]